LRRVVVWDAEQKRQMEILTNHLEFAATTLANIYRDRWQIELFFKALKQNLKVKSFVGTSENALRIQIWTALLALLLLKWLHFLSAAGWSLSNLASLLRLNLFTYRDLKEWLDKPLGTPPLRPYGEQLGLPLAGPGQLAA
jgi:IS4 transposase